MTNRFLRHKQDGTIYDWNPILARNEMCEEVTEEQAYPERAAKPAPKRAKKAITPVESTNTPVETKLDIVYDENDLREEASRGLP